MAAPATHTVFCLSPDMPASDPGSDRAEIESLRAGRLVSGSAGRLCFLRKISESGAILHFDGPAASGETLEIELMDGIVLAGEVAWREGCEIGLRFHAPVDVMDLIARDLIAQPGERRRLPRIELACTARVQLGEEVLIVTVRDISQGGLKVEMDAAPPAGTRIQVLLDGLGPVQGEVRWSQGGVTGIAFTEELDWSALIPWVAARRRGAPPVRAFKPEAPAEPEQGVTLSLPARVRDGLRRWNIEVSAISTRHVEFESYATLQPGALLWIVLPGLEGWPARITRIEGYLFTCEFTQPLHPAVLERILAAGPPPPRSLS